MSFLKKSLGKASEVTITSLFVAVVGLLVNLLTPPLVNIIRNTIINTKYYQDCINKKKDSFPNVVLGISKDDINEYRDYKGE